MFEIRQEECSEMCVFCDQVMRNIMKFSVCSSSEDVMKYLCCEVS